MATQEATTRTDASPRSREAEKEVRKAAEFAANTEEARARASAWTPREAVAQFKKDLADYIGTGDATERRFLGRDIAFNAEANPSYQEAMKQSGYLHVKDSLLLPERQGNILPLGHVPSMSPEEAQAHGVALGKGDAEGAYAIEYASAMNYAEEREIQFGMLVAAGAHARGDEPVRMELAEANREYAGRVIEFNDRYVLQQISESSNFIAHKVSSLKDVELEPGAWVSLTYNEHGLASARQGHPADPLAGLPEPLPGKQSTPAEREAEYLSAIIGAADQLAEIGRMPARQVRDLAKVDAEMMEHISSKAARKSALSAMASAAMVQPGYKRALLDTHPTLASELATASRFAVVLSDASGKHLLDFHTHGTDQALRSFTAAVRTEMPKSEKGAEVLLVDQAERLAARAVADGHGQFNMHYGQEQNRAIFETSLAGSQPDQDGWERMPSVPDAFMRANVDAGVAEVKQDGVIQPIGSIADARAWAEENHATPTDETRLVDLNMEARELHSHAPVRSTPQSSQPEVEKMQASTPTNTEVQRIGSNMPKADWQEALNLLKQKTPQGMRAAMYIPKAGGEYGGPVMMATETHVVQKVGRNTAMIHDLSKLDMDPAMKAQLEAGKIVNSRLNVKYGQERGQAATLTYNQARAGELKQELREWATKAITNVKGRETFLKHADNFTKDLAQREVKAPPHQAPQQRRGDLARDR